jgi:hypothetical protein
MLVPKRRNEVPKSFRGAILLISVLALSGLMRVSWLGPSQDKFAERIFVVVVPEAVYTLSAVMLWHLRKRVACGITSPG